MLKEPELKEEEGEYVVRFRDYQLFWQAYNFLKWVYENVDKETSIRVYLEDTEIVGIAEVNVSKSLKYLKIDKEELDLIYMYKGSKDKDGRDYAYYRAPFLCYWIKRRAEDGV